MDLDDMKTNWKNYDTMLGKHLVLDQQALRKRNLDKSEGALLKPFAHEIANILVVLTTVIFVLLASFKHLNELRFSVPGLIGALLGSIYVYIALTKALKISKLDFKLPIIEIQKKVSRFTILILKFRKLEIALLPFFIVSILPITFWVVQNRDLYVHWGFFVLMVTFIVGFSLVGIRWVNKHLYDQKIKKIQLFLTEIRQFEESNSSL
ncbi:hypothetical protein BKI52_29615 [marine bacterium AO1-C]|nr:hypothetical protein BKI52_29615 [marine bacterium AO1-C]